MGLFTLLYYRIHQNKQSNIMLHNFMFVEKFIKIKSV